MVAIPASIVAHFFETRIINMFHEINELMFNLLPLVERFEGRVRFGPKQAEQANVPPAAGEPQAEPPAAGN
jgi:biopolymer transport protein ExbB